MRVNNKLITALLSMAVAGGVFASDASDLISKLSHGQMTVVKSFKSVGNLEGLVIQPMQGPKQEAIVYVDKDGRYMIPGPLIDASGVNIAQRDFATQITAVQAPQIYADVAKTNWVEDGKVDAPHKAYIVVEPNCSACHMLYNGLKPMIDSGQLQVRWIFVAFMNPQSAGMAAAIMQAKDPGKMISMDEKKFNMQTEMGGIKPVPVSKDRQDKINQNLDFMSQAGFVGTPGIIFMGTDGKPQIVRGVPQGPAVQDMVNHMSNNF